MPTRSPRFWLEIVILGFMLVFGMAALVAWLPQPWGSLARILYSAILFGTYAVHYDRYWNKHNRP